MITVFLISKFGSPINFGDNDPINANFIITLFKPKYNYGEGPDAKYPCIGFEIAYGSSNRKFWVYEDNVSRDKEYDNILNTISIPILKVSVVDDTGRVIGNG